MILVAYLPWLVALLGALVYALAASSKAAEFGRLAFACGLLVGLMTLAGHVVRLP